MRPSTGRWLLRLALLLFLLSLIRPPQSRAPLGPPQSVQTTQPHVCVHTRLIDEVYAWKIQRSLELVREMGASTIVEFFPWAYIETRPGHYDWHSADRILRHAENQGLTVLARMGFVPQWARPADSTLNTLPPERYDDFARFVAAFAERYADTVTGLIIWNEPNLHFEWGYQDVSPADYARLLEAVHAPVKAAHPDALILGGALAPTLEPSGSAHGLDDLIYLDALLDAGAAEHFDVLAVHTYGFTQPPDAPPAPDALNFRRVELLADVLARHDAEKPIVITETGWNDHPRWTQAVRPSQRIAYTLDAYDLAADWPWLDQMCLWAFRYPAPTGSYPDHFTLVTSDFQLKPLYYALQAYARADRNFSERERQWLPPPDAE